MSASWKRCIVICLVIYSSMGAKVGQQYTSRKALVDRELCTPEIAAKGCQPVPRECDVLNLTAFGTTINGKTYSAVWRIDRAGFDKHYPTLVMQVGFHIDVDQNITRIGRKYRQGKTPSSNCTSILHNTTLASRERAVLDFDFDMPYGFTPTRTWVVSNQPDKYLFEFCCMNRNNVINGVCYDRWLINVMVLEDKLDDPPMHDIVSELRQKFDVKLDHPQNTFLRIGYECPGNVLPF